MSKLDDEIQSFKGMLKGGGRGFLREFNNPFSTSALLYIEKAAKSVPLLWFMAGLGVEALGLAVQGMLGMDAYPLLDFLVAAIIVTALYVYQNRGDKHV